MSDMTVREAAPDEAAAIAELLNAHAQTLFGEPEVAAAEIRHWFTLPNVVMRVAEGDGRLVGYCDIGDEHGEGKRFPLDLRTVDGDAADALIADAEAHARGRASATAVVRGYAASVDEVVAGAYERAGYRVIRHSFQMRIELDGEVPQPRLPDGIDIRTLEPGEEQRVHEAQMEAFADHWDFRYDPFDEWRRYLVDKHDFDPSLWFLAEEDGEIAGIALCAWHFSGDRQFGWVEILGVRPQWRRRGLGGALLQHAFREFAARGATRVGLGVDAENTTGAVRLYERAGMRVVRRSDTYEKRL